MPTDTHTERATSLDAWNDGAPGNMYRAAEHLDVTPRTIARWIEQHDLPVHRVGVGRRAVQRFYRAELDQWLRSRCSDSTPGGAS
jgi:excisionase family DNA binding protein